MSVSKKLKILSSPPKECAKAKGYPDSWIEKRMRGIAIRETLTKEWEQRGIKEQREYAILTAEISESYFWSQANRA